MSETAYADSLIEWGRSGSLYPTLIPDDESQKALEDVQRQILEQSPTLESTTNLHSTLFYIKPTRLFDRLRGIHPAISEARVYMELATTMGASLLTGSIGSRELSTSVEGVDRFGPNNEAVVLKLADIPIMEHVRACLYRNLGWSGFTEQHLAELATDPEYQWVFGDSTLHMSLALGSGSLDLSTLTLPETVSFKGLSAGSIQAPGETADEQRRWYIMGC